MTATAPLYDPMTGQPLTPAAPAAAAPPAADPTASPFAQAAAAVAPMAGSISSELMSVTPPPAAEPGWRTTEFWATGATMVVSFVASAGVFTQADAVRLGGLITGAAAIVGYAISRGIRKAGTAA